MKSMRMLYSSLLVCVVSVGLAGCMELQRRLQYENLDAVAVDATGKQLWQIEFGDREVRQVRNQLGRTQLKSLYCMRDNADARLFSPSGLSVEEKRRRISNIKLLMDRALIPEIEQRESEGKRRIVLDSCNTR